MDVDNTGFFFFLKEWKIVALSNMIFVCVVFTTKILIVVYGYCYVCYSNSIYCNGAQLEQLLLVVKSRLCCLLHNGYKF